MSFFINSLRSETTNPELSSTGPVSFPPFLSIFSFLSCSSTIFSFLSILEPLVEQGAESRMELIRVLQRKANAESEISRKNAEIQSLQERIPALKDRVSRTQVVSPKNGIINRMVITTIGGVADPGPHPPFPSRVGAADRGAQRAVCARRSGGWGEER
mgnify:CR=1 FL=1